MKRLVYDLFALLLTLTFMAGVTVILWFISEVIR